MRNIYEHVFHRETEIVLLRDAVRSKLREASAVNGSLASFVANRHDTAKAHLKRAVQVGTSVMTVAFVALTWTGGISFASDPSASIAAGRIVIGDKDFGYFKSESRWPSLADGTTVVFVCWEQPEINRAQEREWVKSAVSQSWEDNSKLRFRGWGTCAARSSGIRIAVADDGPDDGPHTAGLGRALDGEPAGMLLNFTFKTWSEPCAASDAIRKSCIQSVGVHEFGHAIGLAHEQNRPDKPGECMKPAQGESGDRLLTPYDPKSVMNYCNPVYNNLGVLSDLDKVSVQTIYGKP